MTKNKFISKLLTVAVAMVGTVSMISCSDDDENKSKIISSVIVADDEEYVLFELKYSESVNITFHGEHHTLRLYDVVDNVYAGCATIEFIDEKIPDSYQTFAYIVCDEKDSMIVSKPCGARGYEFYDPWYKAGGYGIEGMANYYKALKDSAYHGYITDYVNWNGTLTNIGAINMEMADPVRQPSSPKTSYKFVFILTNKKQEL